MSQSRLTDMRSEGWHARHEPHATVEVDSYEEQELRLMPQESLRLGRWREEAGGRARHAIA
eukprot:360468-Chlamydomonas_euryale.AAC.4